MALKRICGTGTLLLWEKGERAELLLLFTVKHCHSGVFLVIEELLMAAFSFSVKRGVMDGGLFPSPCCNGWCWRRIQKNSGS